MRLVLFSDLHLATASGWAPPMWPVDGTGPCERPYATWFSSPMRWRQPHALFQADQIPEAGLDHALVGHFHTPRDADYHTYPGNPDPLTFGEEGPRGAVVLGVDGDGSLCRERHWANVSQVHDCSLSVDGCATSYQVRLRVEEALDGLEGRIRVTLQGSWTRTWSSISTRSPIWPTEPTWRWWFPALSSISAMTLSGLLRNTPSAASSSATFAPPICLRTDSTGSS